MSEIKIDMIYGVKLLRPEMVLLPLEPITPSVGQRITWFIGDLFQLILIILVLLVGSASAVKHPDAFATGLMMGTIMSVK